MDKNQEARRAAMQRGLGIAALNVNSSGGNGRGSVGASSGGGGGVAKKPCYFHNHGGCKSSAAKCRFAHDLLPEAERAKMVRPAARSPSPSPTRGRVDGGAPHKNPGYCFKFIKGDCSKDDCAFAHLSPEAAKEFDRAKAKSKAKAKAQPKAKAVGTGIAVPAQAGN